MSRQKLGQHFLHSPAWRERIARTLPADANATWLEIGPGHGEMTEFLAQRAHRVIAIETDAALAASLRQRASGLPSLRPSNPSPAFAANLPAKAVASAARAEWPNVEIIEADILSVDLSPLLLNQSTSSQVANDSRMRSSSTIDRARTLGGPGFSPDVPSAPSSGVSTPEDTSSRKGTAFYPDEGRAAVPQGDPTSRPLGPEVSLASLESGRVRKGTVFYPARPGEGGQERRATAPNATAPVAHLGAEDSCKPPEPIDLRKGTVSTVPQGDPTSRPLGPEASSAAPDAHESVATGIVGRGFSRDEKAGSHSGALAPEENSYDATTPSTHSSFVGQGFSPDKTDRTNSGALAPEVHTENEPQARTTARFRVYGNLPYYITSPTLSYLFRFTAQIDSIHIVIQYEVAARIVATPGHREYAYLSALCQYFARPEIILRIPPGAFRPPPKVNSALVAMNLPGERARLGIRDDAAFLKFLQNCFSQKRKTLRNNLKNVFSDAQIAAALAACKLTPKSRAEEISLTQFAELYRQLAPEE